MDCLVVAFWRLMEDWIAKRRKRWMGMIGRRKWRNSDEGRRLMMRVRGGVESLLLVA
jgi:hypothetical protein